MVRNFSYIIEGSLAGSADPGQGGRLGENLAWLYEQGIRSIVTLTESGIPNALLAENGMRWLHVPIADFTPPTMEQARQAVEFVRHSIAGDKPALIHCASGYGRTGTLLACYLVSTGLSADEAIGVVRERRPGSIETYEQEEAVRAFEAEADNLMA